MISIIKRAFVALPKGLGILVILAAIMIIFNVVNVSLTSETGAAQITAKQAIALIINFVVFILLVSFINGGVLSFFKELIQTGAGNIKNFAANGKKYFLRMLALTGILILITLAIGLLGNWFAALFEGKAAVRIVIIAIQLFVGALIVFPIYALVAEDKGAIESFFNALKRSVKNYTKILLLLVFLLLIMLALIFIAGFIIGLLNFLIKGAAINIITAVIMGSVTALWMFLSMESLLDFYLKPEV